MNIRSFSLSDVNNDIPILALLERSVAPTSAVFMDPLIVNNPIEQ